MCSEKETIYGHPSEDRTYRFAFDAFLRSRGFKIHSRQKNNPAIWIKESILFKVHELWMRLSDEDKKIILNQEDLYFKGCIRYEEQ